MRRFFKKRAASFYKKYKYGHIIKMKLKFYLFMGEIMISSYNNRFISKQ